MSEDTSEPIGGSHPSSRNQRLVIACQGGGSHTAFTAGVLDRLCATGLDGYEVAGLSGTSGGAVCALLAWAALRENNPSDAGRLLAEFWEENSATSPWDQIVNAGMMLAGDLQDYVSMPVLSPYNNPFEQQAADQFKELLTRRVDFDTITADTAGPALVIGAVDVQSGAFCAFDSRQEAITADMVLASAAIPNLFRAVEIDGGSYWDGLFSQNPPIRELIELMPDEIWVIQINPTQRNEVPRTILEIDDRRNELSGNLSLNQELHFIEKIDRWLEDGVLAPDSDYRRIVVRVIELSADGAGIPLSVRSKLNRDPAFIQTLMEHGRAQADAFQTALAFERAWRAQDLETLLSHLDPEVKITAATPLNAPGSTGGRDTPEQMAGLDAARTVLEPRLSTTQIDLTRKQVVGDTVTWTVKPGTPATPAPASTTTAPKPGTQTTAPKSNAQIAITLRDGRVTAIRLGA